MIEKYAFINEFEVAFNFLGDNGSPPSPSVTIHLNNRTFSSDSPTNNNDSLLDDKNKSLSKTLTPSDSGIIICVPSNNQSPTDDSSSIGGKSLDSGVYDAEANSGIKSNPSPWKESKDSDPKKSKRRKDSVKKDPDQESLLAICIQVFIPFLIAGTGTCGAGIVLDYAEVSVLNF